MNVTEPKVVLVTGASSGIGEATARHLAAMGHRVVAGARRTDRLAALAAECDGAVDGVELDVASLDSVQAFVAHATARYGRVDVLVNNAGVMPLSPMADLRVHEWDQMIDVNLRGTLYGIAAVLPGMRARGSGHIVNISSVSGHRVDPTAAVYSATKFAVRALSEGLRQENDDIRVTVVSPGFTHSELTHQGGAPDARSAARAAAEQLAIPATAIAEAIAFAVTQPRDVDVNELVVRPTAQR
ncbi:NADP-dependent 3-hydroxy acid dehydrogenase YdfG [Streptomyces sp. SAI-133]|uniref:SDR family oxidoreductase n=1 Tax=unclassified Streptomyces TaxID=2593676 RepID=UPI0024731F0E|nr:SDR family oxidoreductase [Streptomyces sp. SAI-133]MDH6589797.1 NADP-dependent 3-hydroxy acid dehydrogenase YdfG [Streptomyces sp. SAI-133]